MRPSDFFKCRSAQFYAAHLPSLSTHNNLMQSILAVQRSPARFCAVRAKNMGLCMGFKRSRVRIPPARPLETKSGKGFAGIGGFRSKIQQYTPSIHILGSVRVPDSTQRCRALCESSRDKAALGCCVAGERRSGVGRSLCARGSLHAINRPLIPPQRGSASPAIRARDSSPKTKRRETPCGILRQLPQKRCSAHGATFAKNFP